MSDLDRAIRAFDAAHFVAKHGGRKESRGVNSHEYLVNCPLCGGHNLRWNTMKGSGQGAWKCWNCNTTGNTLYLIQLLERITLEGAITYVRGEYVGGDASLELKDIAFVPEQIARSIALQRLPPIIKPPSIDAREHPRVRAYLHGRGIDDATIAAWGLLAGISGRESNYVIFPVVMEGVVVYWQARASWDPPPLDPESKRAWIKATHYRKTLNPSNPGEGIAQATAGDVLFNYDRACRCEHVVVVEGPVDAVKVGTNAVALLGKGTDTKIARLRRMRARRYTVYLDRGEEEHAKAVEIANSLRDWAEVHLATPPEGYDAGALTPEQNAYVIAHAVPFQAATGLKSSLIP